jgi:hypothetical protein
VTKDVVLEDVRRFAEESNIRFGKDELTAKLDVEIQEIFEAIHVAWRGSRSKRGIWVADGCKIGNILAPEHDIDRILRDASGALGIELAASDLWEDAAMRLRSRRTQAPC